MSEADNESGVSGAACQWRGAWLTVDGHAGRSITGAVGMALSRLEGCASLQVHEEERQEAR